MRALKGVGDYTAAAFVLLLMDMPYAVVDGNVYGCFAACWALIRPLTRLEGRRFLSGVPMSCWTLSALVDLQSGYHGFWRFAVYSCIAQLSVLSFNRFLCRASEGGCRLLAPVKQHKTKVANRYFNYIYVRMGAYTFIHKRTEMISGKICMSLLW